jgi:ELWxxDGT repeat protein
MNWLTSLRSRLLGSRTARRASNRPPRGKNLSRRPALEYLEDRLAPSVTMVKDIYSYTNGSYPQNLTDVNGTLFFTAVDNTGNRELFKTDGTAGGTAELTFGNRLSSISNLVNLGGKLFFRANDNVLGNTVLYTSDGSVAGTHPFAANGENIIVYGTDVNAQAVVGSKLYFVGYDTGNNQYDLWLSDGTSAGTHPVQPGTTTGPNIGGWFQAFINVNGTLFFQYQDNTNYQLWKSNGTSAGTVQVAELTPNGPSNFTAVGSTLYFEMYDSTPGLYALWTASGSTATKVADIGTTSNQFYGLTAFGSKVWFQVYDPTDATLTGWALWSSDGTAGNTGVFKFNGNATPVNVGGNSQMAVMGTNLYFEGYDSTNGYALWKTDGVAANNKTATVQTTGSSPFTNGPTFLAVVGTKLFFRSYDTSNNRYDLWKSDGTSAGTGPVQTGSLVAQGVGDYSTIVGSNGKAFFDAYDVDANNQSPHNYELWSSDGTAANTAMVTDINTTTSGSNPTNLTGVGNEVFFLASDNTANNLLYQSDGTAAGTVPVQTSAHVLPTSVSNLTVVGSTLFFTASGPDGYELWTSGTAPNSASPFQHGGSQEIANSISDLVSFNGLLYFFAYDNANAKYALWKSDGTQANTVPVADIDNNGNLGQLAGAGSNLFFAHYDSVNSTWALWKYNGTTASQVMDISANGIQNMTTVGSRVFFQAYDYGVTPNQWALWTSDGTTTTQLTHFTNGNMNSQIAFGGKLFYDAYNPANGYNSLYMSDGTAAGTQLYLTSGGNPVILGTSQPYFTVIGGTLYFEDLYGQYQVGKTDGTPGGYTEVQAGSTGTLGINPSYLVNDNGTLVFDAYDSAHGYELWQSDGTAAGTQLLADIVPGTGSSSPSYLAVAGNQVFFNAYDPTHGYELWVATVSATVVTAGLSGPTDGVTMQHRPFVLTANDSNTGNNPAGFSFAINWGDGSSQTVTGQSGITTDHQYGSTGSFIISVTATNLADGVTSAAVTQTENITSTEMQGGNVAVGGVPGNDAFVITKGTTGTYTVKVNAAGLLTNFKPGTGQLIYLYGGNGTTTYTINDTGTTADAFTLGTDYVTFIKTTFISQSPGAWTVNGNNAADTYTIAGPANASINGGTANDSFKFISTVQAPYGTINGSLTGTINGGGGTNTLDYSKYTTSVIVDLPLGSATGVTGGISNIQNVTGSQNGGDILVGDQNANVLKANKGHNILIGGSGGGDTLTSGGADILIAGSTIYDSNLAALQFILNEWKSSSPATYLTTINNIKTSATDPLSAAQVSDSGSPDHADTLNGKGAASSDWFFAHQSGGTNPNDTITGQGSGDQVEPI